MSEQLDMVIRGGTVVTASDRVRCDVGIRNGKIAALAEFLPAARQEIAAGGKLVLPGAIDSHCHIEQRSSMGITTADDFFSGGRSAACGGTTTLIPFAAQHRGESLLAAVREYRQRADEKSFIDYAIHMILSDPTPKVIHEELPRLIDDGNASFKIYLTYDSLRLNDGQALQVLAAAKREGTLVMVHAENHDAIAWFTEQLLSNGKTGPRFHAASRPTVVEREAIHRIIALAEIVDAPILVVHVSSAEGVEQIRWARERGRTVYGETCPQYLLLTAENMNLPDFEGARFMCSPPLRDGAAQQALWRGLQAGTLQVVSSDHAPYRFNDPKGKKLFGENPPFNKVPNGLPGLEVCFPLLFSEGVSGKRITLEQFVALSSTNAARLYGLYPRKGTIAIGSDADIAIWDADKEVEISLGMLHDSMDYTPYEGIRVRGWPVTTISRGEVLWDGDELHGNSGRGCFVPCERPLFSGQCP